MNQFDLDNKFNEKLILHKKKIKIKIIIKNNLFIHQFKFYQ